MDAMNSKIFERFAVTFESGDLIFCEYEPGDSFFFIKSGQVKISKIMGDIEKTIDILKPGEFFGEMSLLENAARSASAIAIEKVTALEFNKENFKVLMEGQPQIALKLLKLFAKRIFDQKRRLMILTLDDNQAKIADVFLMLSESFKPPEEDNNERSFDVTVEDVANWAGMPKNDAFQVLNQFSSQQRIEILKDKIIVRNINDFERLVSTKRKQDDD